MPPARQPDQSAPRTTSPTGVGFDARKEQVDDPGVTRAAAGRATQSQTTAREGSMIRVRR